MPVKCSNHNTTEINDRNVRFGDLCESAKVTEYVFTEAGKFLGFTVCL